MKKFNLITSLILLIGFLSCTSEPKVEEPQLSTLIGKWELKEAYINNKRTPRLDGAYLEFGENGSLSTNILGQAETGTFEMNKSKLVQKTGQEVKYDIEKLENNELDVVMHLGSRKFKIKFGKVE